MSDYHDGEIKVQEMAGARRDAENLAGSVFPLLPPGAQRFLTQQLFSAITWRDEQGRLWITPLTGKPGFLFAVDETSIACDLRATTAPMIARRVFTGEPAALVTMDFKNRRRMRINGSATSNGKTDAFGNQEWLTIETAEVYGNCPKYIQRREPIVAESDEVVSDETTDRTVDSDECGTNKSCSGHAKSEHVSAQSVPSEIASEFSDVPKEHEDIAPDDWYNGQFEKTFDESARALINNADTFFIGTFSSGGADASHRGGNKGFVRAVGNTVSWFDFPGNNMFNTFGNIQLEREAALLFVDFTSRTCVVVNGVIESFEPSAKGKVAQHETVLRVRAMKNLPFAISSSWKFIDSSPYNP